MPSESHIHNFNSFLGQTGAGLGLAGNGAGVGMGMGMGIRVFLRSEGLRVQQSGRNAISVKTAVRR